MGFGSPLHWIVLVLVVVLLFGGGRISSLMGDVAKGIKSFKKGMADDEDETPRKAVPVQHIEVKAADPAPQPTAAPVSSEPRQG
ncbi:MAG: twin-arginine translocase TatA/TatE family subunit [Sphingobium sp.]